MEVGGLGWSRSRSEFCLNSPKPVLIFWSSVYAVCIIYIVKSCRLL